MKLIIELEPGDLNNAEVRDARGGCIALPSGRMITLPVSETPADRGEQDKPESDSKLYGGMMNFAADKPTYEPDEPNPSWPAARLADKPRKTEGMNWDEAEAAMLDGECVTRRDPAGNLYPAHKMFDGVVRYVHEDVVGSVVGVHASDQSATDWHVVPDPSRPDDTYANGVISKDDPSILNPDPYPLNRDQAFNVLAEGGKVRTEKSGKGCFLAMKHGQVFEFFPDGHSDPMYLTQYLLDHRRWQQVTD